VFLVPKPGPRQCSGLCVFAAQPGVDLCKSSRKTKPPARPQAAQHCLASLAGDAASRSSPSGSLTSLASLAQGAASSSSPSWSLASLAQGAVGKQAGWTDTLRAHSTRIPSAAPLCATGQEKGSAIYIGWHHRRPWMTDWWPSCPALGAFPSSVWE
jgi:hypothetical protein